MDRNDLIWNPWHGCHKYSEGCQNCYAFFLDKRYGRDTNLVARNKNDFNLPIKRTRSGEYKMPSGSNVRVCMASDFFIEEADEWRSEAWDIIRKRPDLMFSLLTKRVDRIAGHLPDDWGDGWDNVTFAVSCENQQQLEKRVPGLLKIPAKHRWISLKPFIGEVDLDAYLSGGEIEWVLAGGENYLGSRPLHYSWVEKVYEQCKKYNVKFTFGQTGNIFVKDGEEYKIRDRTEQMVQALKSGLNYPAVDIDREVDAIYRTKAEKKQAFEARKRS